jgi:phosphatidylinositol 4-kinase
VRDRHNANILVDADGHLIHIDYGFIFGDSPGLGRIHESMNFETAPFKLTREYLEVMGGVDSQAFKQFEDLFVRGFFALQKHADALGAIVQLFYGERRKQAADGLRSRLLFAASQVRCLSI